MLSQTEQFRLCVPDIPHADTSIQTPCAHKVLIKRRIVHTHYFCHMRLNTLAHGLLTFIPNLELLIVTYTRELIDIKLIPRHIFYDLRMCVPLHERVNRRRQLIRLIYVPHADLIVIAT